MIKAEKLRPLSISKKKHDIPGSFKPAAHFLQCALRTQTCIYLFPLPNPLLVSTVVPFRSFTIVLFGCCLAAEGPRPTARALAARGWLLCCFGGFFIFPSCYCTDTGNETGP